MYLGHKVKENVSAALKVAGEKGANIDRQHTPLPPTSPHPSPIRPLPPPPGPSHSSQVVEETEHNSKEHVYDADDHRHLHLVRVEELKLVLGHLPNLR